MAKKDSYYFPHDCNAKDDPKCMLLIDQLGLEGYGIYWVLIETLRNQPDYRCPISMLPALARRYNTSAEKMLTAVKSFSLFVVKNDSIFFSQSLLDRMSKVDATRKRLSDSGIKGNKIRWQSPSDHNAIALNQIKLNQTKINQIKEDKIIVEKRIFNKPNIEEILSEIKDTDEAERFLNYYESNGWKVGRNPMKNWKAAAKNWIRNSKNYNNGNSIASKQLGTSGERIEAARKW